MLSQIIAEASQTENVIASMDENEIQLMQDTVEKEELEIEKSNIAIDALFITAEGFASLGQTCFAAAKDGGLTTHAINAITNGAQATGRLVGIKVNIPSGEAFEEDGSRVDETMLTGESLMDSAKNVYKIVKDFIMRQIEKIKQLWKTHLSSLGRMKKSIDAAQAKYASVTGKATKDKFKINLGAIMKGDKVAGVDLVKGEATTLKSLPNAIKAQTASVKAIAADFDKDVDAAIASLSSTVTMLEIPNAKDAKETDKQKVSMTEGYTAVKVNDDLLGGDLIAFGTPSPDSEKGPRAAWVAGKVDAKKSNTDHPTLSAGDISGYLTAAAMQRNLAEELTEESDKYSDELLKLAKQIEKAGKDKEGEELKKFNTAAKKARDYVSLVTVGTRGLVGHCISASKASFNYAVSSAKLYKEEK